MIFDVIRQKNVPPIPPRVGHKWGIYTDGITEAEVQGIMEWINDKFDEVLRRNEKVQLSGWLVSGFDWQGSPLFPIYRECLHHLAYAADELMAEESGQIFGLYVSMTLSDRPETWCFVKGEEYWSVPIANRVYFLPRAAFA